MIPRLRYRKENTKNHEVRFSIIEKLKKQNK
jgi:hypothetical protein